jgi:hypothetical protein
MFVRYFIELPDPADQVAAVLFRDPEAWVPGLARQADDGAERLLAEVGFSPAKIRVEKRVEIEVGTPMALPSKTVLPISWKATGPEGLFPSLEADLELAPLGSARAQLAISARYTPPLGLLGRAIDRALLHRVAEATLKDFLDRVGRVVQSSRVEPGA